MKSKRKLIIIFVFVMIIGNMYSIYAKNELTTDESIKYEKQYIESYLDEVASGDHDFFEQKIERSLNSKQPFNELELKLLENEKRAEFIEEYYSNTLQKSNYLTKELEPEILSYNMQKAIKVEMAEYDFFKSANYNDIISFVNENDYYIWFVPAVDNLNENVTLSISKKNSSSALYPDAIYKTVSGEDYLNQDLIYENIEEDFSDDNIIYVKYFNSIIAVVKTDSEEFIVPIVNGETLGLFEQKAYVIEDVFPIILDYLS